MTYTAVISRNFRDINTTPKVLIREVTDDLGNLIRDHMWIPLSKAVEQMLPPSGKNGSYKVKFIAKETTYQTDGPEKKTLKSIKQARLLHRL